MKRIMKAVIGAAVVIALAPLPSAGARADDVAVDTRPQYYFTVHIGMIKYNVNDVVKRWNRNPYVRLTRVYSCANVNPCVDIWEKPELDPKTFNYDPHNVAGIYFPSDYVSDWTFPKRSIEIYTWWQQFAGFTFKDAQRARQQVLCHELGHYLLGPASMPHPETESTCLSNQNRPYWPGSWGLSHVSTYLVDALPK